MNFYYSFSTKIHQNIFQEDKYNKYLNRVVEWTKESVNYLRANYNNIYLITDKLGEKIFNNISFSNIFNDLENISCDYPEVWSLPKIYALSIIANKNKPFIHIDYDFFITRKLSDNIINADILLQSKEYDLDILKYNVEIFDKKCPIKYIKNYQTKSYAYNCGIIGGNNYDFYKTYTKNVINMITDSRNKCFWIDTKFNNQIYWTKAVLAEQYYIGCLLEENNIKPVLLFDILNNYSPYIYEHFEKTGAVHLFGHYKYLKTKGEAIEKCVQKLYSRNINLDTLNKIKQYR